MTAAQNPAGNNLDQWYGHYADRTAGLAASEVRALFAVASRPEVVSLAGGMPFVSALPKELVTGAMERVMRDQGPVALQYGSGQGCRPCASTSSRSWLSKASGPASTTSSSRPARSTPSSS